MANRDDTQKPYNHLLDLLEIPNANLAENSEDAVGPCSQPLRYVPQRTCDGYDKKDDESLVGEACHIVAQKVDGPRGVSPLTVEQRDKNANLILLCNIHHKQIDDQFNTYSVSKLEELKTQHESWVRTQLGFDPQKQKEDELLAGYVEEWVRRLNLDDWKTWATCIMCHGLPTLYHDRKVALEDIGQWLLSRFWLPRYPELVAAFANFRVVAQDFCFIFNEHAERQGDFWCTRKFYQLNADWSKEREPAAEAI